MDQLHHAWFIVCYCLLLLQPCLSAFTVPSVDAAPPLQEQIEPSNTATHRMFQAVIGLDKNYSDDDLLEINAGTMDQYAMVLYQKLTDDEKTKCHDNTLRYCVVAAMYVPGTRKIFASTVPTAGHKGVMVTMGPEYAPAWWSSLQLQGKSNEAARSFFYHAEDAVYFKFESSTASDGKVHENRYPTGTVIGTYGRIKKDDVKGAFPIRLCGAAPNRNPSCQQAANALGVGYLPQAANAPGSSKHKQRLRAEDPSTEPEPDMNIMQEDEDIIAKCQEAAKNLTALCPAPPTNPWLDEKKKPPVLANTSKPTPRPRALTLTTPTSTPNPCPDMCLKYPTPIIGIEQDPTVTGSSRPFEPIETPVPTPLKGKIQASLGNSKVPAGTLTASELFTSLSHALESLCPTPTSAGAWTSCKNESQLAVEGIIYPGTDGSEMRDGELVVRAPNSKYNITEARDALIKATAMAAQNQTGSMCYNQTVDIFGKRSDYSIVGYPTHSKRFPPIPIHVPTCDVLGFVGVEYFNPWWQSDVEPGSTYNLFMTTEFKIASSGDQDVCALLEAIDGVLTIVAPEFAFEEIGAAEVVNAICSEDEE